MSAPQVPWSQTAAEVTSGLGVDPAVGLDSGQVEQRLRRDGPNRLPEVKSRSLAAILWAQLRSLLVGLLALAAGIGFLFGDTVEAYAILAVIALNTAIGFFSELRAVRSMEALRRLGVTTCRVRREGALQELPDEALVVGDVVLLEGGDLVPADLRVLDSARLQVDESALTGESLPVAKHADPVPPGTPLAERACMLYRGTAVSAGTVLGVVTATGVATELGMISRLVAQAKPQATPLEKRLDRLGQRLAGLALLIAAAIAATGLAADRDLMLMVMTGIALAVAALPEGLPVVATLSLARGMHRMARRNALINRLAAVETLGATSVICTDKTGTLTQNRLTVTHLVLPGPGPLEVPADAVPASLADVRDRLLHVGRLCNNAALHGDGGVGDPLEVALLQAARGITLADPERLREEPFDPVRRLMATVHRVPGGYRVAVKGAPEAVLARCVAVADGSDSSPPLTQTLREQWLAANDALAGRGLRVLALAERYCNDVAVDPYADLTVLGLVGLMDPPRGDVLAAIDQCRAAGIRVVMVTGDQPATANHVAQTLHLIEPHADGPVAGVLPGEALERPQDFGGEDAVLAATVFARVSPAQKMALVTRLQARGEVVAMTGDGVNDAPALKQADIGIAMGLRGTQVARQAAAMVLRDDAFSSIAAAVAQGRVIFGNIRRFVVYLLSCNLSEVLVVGLATLAGGPLPLLPLQILFLNLVTDVFPALALGAGEADGSEMRQPPRPSGEPLLTRQHWWQIVGHGGSITAATLLAFALALKLLAATAQQAVVVAFLTLALAQLWHVLNMRPAGSGRLDNAVTRNPYVWGALGLCLGLLALAVYCRPLAQVLHLAPPDARQWGLIVAASLLPLLPGMLRR
ncbi:cation-transporting P-type ATPase [Immundisolibacter sp.]|uniref:cation-translocating P-type ATPase n=1 Tax=Immundisolibacter sp. TaxID=1934948 RepID=UPI002B0B96C3|nr:cation-transporting P-type ATPase [Immundisolibacter sp.]MEA3219707.1 Calcium-transporting ATPase 1 [Immundisolibacter sp.]